MSILAAAKADRNPDPKAVSLPPKTQRVCIDLPGEDFSCYVTEPNVEIMLRKHRDVVFDLRLFNGMNYTVEADQSDFYNARDKKLVEFKKKQKVVFKDGERLHLWIGRYFVGNLILKANGKIFGKYQPGQLDLMRYGAEPATKPAPLLVVMKNDDSPARKPSASSTNIQPDLSGISLWNMNPVQSAMGLDSLILFSRNKPTLSGPVEQHPTVAVVDGTTHEIPQKILDYFSAGGGKSGWADVDPNEVTTRNWLLGQLAGSAAYVGDNWNWLRHSLNRRADGAFKLVSAKVSLTRGKIRIYFSGYSRVNPAFGPGGYASANTKILQIFAGVGKIGAVGKSALSAIGGSFKGNALVSFIFGTFSSWTEWQADAKKDGYDLAGGIISSLIKAIVVAALTTIAVALLLLALLIGAEISFAVLAVGAITLAVGWGVAYGVDVADKALGREWKGPENSDGVAAGFSGWLRDAGRQLDSSWKYLSEKFPIDYRIALP